MFGADKKYLTISINDGVIKIAQVTSNGNLEKAARLPVGAKPPEEAGKALKAMLASFDRRLPVICAVPAGSAAAKNIEVPSTDNEEIRSIINLQASRHTPYSREEVLISYINLGLNAQNNTRLLLVIVHRDVIKQLMAVLTAAGLEADRVIFAPEAQARLYARSINVKKEAGAVGVVDFSANAAVYMVISRGSLSFVRNMPVGIKALAEGGAALAKLQEEFKKSMEAFLQDDGNQAPASYVVTTGNEAVIKALPALKEALNVTFKAQAPTDFIKTSGGLRKKLQAEWGDDSFLDVAAPGPAAGRCEINLMPEELVLKKTVERQSKEASKAGVAAVIIMVLVGAMIMTDIYFKDSFLNNNLLKKFAPQKQEVESLEQKMGKVKLVRNYLQGRTLGLEVIHELYRITPHSIYLSNVAMEEDGTVTIDGVSESMSQVFSYVKSLDDSTVFMDAKTKSTSTKKDNGKDVAAFEIEFKLAALSQPTEKEPA